MFNILGESLIFISPPVNAVLAGVVWKYGLSWPNLERIERVSSKQQQSYKQEWENSIRTLKMVFKKWYRRT